MGGVPGLVQYHDFDICSLRDREALFIRQLCRAENDTAGDAIQFDQRPRCCHLRTGPDHHAPGKRRRELAASRQLSPGHASTFADDRLLRRDKSAPKRARTN